jgi:hypothetical protein
LVGFSISTSLWFLRMQNLTQCHSILLALQRRVMLDSELLQMHPLLCCIKSVVFLIDIWATHHLTEFCSEMAHFVSALSDLLDLTLRKSPTSCPNAHTSWRHFGYWNLGCQHHINISLWNILKRLKATHFTLQLLLTTMRTCT